MDMEILFRGKRLDNGEWVEGHFITDEQDASHAYIGYLLGVNGGVVHDTDIVEVIPYTVCQYTGLTDKNGRKIFERDIVNCSDKRGAAFWRCKVLWNKVKARFDVIVMGCAFPMCSDAICNNIPIDGVDYEAIGNVFDNPSLLEGGSE